MDYNLKYATGNVFRYKGSNSLYIITEVTSQGVDWIPFNGSRISGGTPLETTYKEESCEVCNENGIDEECEYCKGSGHITVERKGMDQTIIVASCVGDFIKQRLNNIFYNFDDE